MGLRKALRLGIVKGQPSGYSLCPRQHDPESFEMLAAKEVQSRKVRTVMKMGEWASRSINQPLPSLEDVKNMTVLKAMEMHNKKCWPGNKEYCSCDWCESNRRRQNAND